MKTIIFLNLLIFFFAAIPLNIGRVDGAITPHPCNRACNGTQMHCSYELNVTTETAMSLYCKECPFVEEDCLRDDCIPGGGIVRPVTVANCMLPGPPIIVCENDTVEVTVRNKLISDTTSIHWHGIHQVGTFFMDGLPMITQYPILPSDYFIHKFKASPHGSHMWHGHSNFQEADGLFGAFIVRREEPEHIKALYDFDLPEHIITVWHWYDKGTGDVLIPILHRNESVYGFGFLINGKAALKNFTKDSKTYNTPREILFVEKGFRYRFRLLYNSAIYCAIHVSIDEHRLKIISSETSYFDPVEVDSLMAGPGDRFDFVLEAGRNGSGCYPLRVRGIGDCAPPKADVHQLAFLCYGNSTTSAVHSVSSSYQEADRNGILLNPFEKATMDYSNKTLVHLVDLNCTEIAPYDYSRSPDHVYYVEIKSPLSESARFPGSWHQFNNVTFKYPGRSLIADGYNTSETCTDDTRKDFCTGDFCTCTYMKHLPINSLVEIILIDLNVDGSQDHPVHLHGYQFYVVAMDAVGVNITTDNIKYRNENGLLKKNLKNAISKDTVSVPNRGYAALRFFTSNTGVWLFHCHVTNHMELGMALLLQVGEPHDILSMCENQKQCGRWSNSASSLHPDYSVSFVLFLFLPFAYISSYQDILYNT